MGGRYRYYLGRYLTIDYLGRYLPTIGLGLSPMLYLGNKATGPSLEGSIMHTT